jgi:hypothetical protein
MSALLPSHDRPTGVVAAAIPTPRVAPPPETFAPEPAMLPRPRPAAVWGVVAGMAAGAVGTLTAAVIVTAPVALPHTAPAPPPVPEPRVAFDGSVTVPGRELTAFGDGTWQVGVDVVPGTYTSTGGPDCRYALRAAVTGGDVAASTVGPGPATVVLAADTGYVETSGCATWQRKA